MKEISSEKMISYSLFLNRSKYHLNTGDMHVKRDRRCGRLYRNFVGGLSLYEEFISSIEVRFIGQSKRCRLMMLSFQLLIISFTLSP